MIRAAGVISILGLLCLAGGVIYAPLFMVCGGLVIVLGILAVAALTGLIDA
jgi:hypothetical protein